MMLIKRYIFVRFALGPKAEKIMSNRKSLFRLLVFESQQTTTTASLIAARNHDIVDNDMTANVCVCVLAILHRALWGEFLITFIGKEFNGN